ncbi:transmembrane protein 272-like [Bombina bombina]|uniref:transmembrane protein 272-like n=1 Tax=Bombina bombina TaxID=8345 RepID=UPI00235A6DEE|nr:transmembrane protein 272-like [Bombina bombina]
MAGDMTQRIDDVVQIIFGLIWTALSIAMIAVGAVFLTQCPAQPMIPIYLIVAGVFSFSFWIFLPLEWFAPCLRKILMFLISLFIFAWFIAGSVWVFRIYNNDPRQCQINMYLFAFAVLIIQYIFIGLAVIYCLISCFCSVILSQSNIHRDTSTTQMILDANVPMMGIHPVHLELENV